MGLLSAISNAVSGLNVNQQNLNVLSQNISNANTPNYSNEVLNQQASFIDGLGTGVSAESITRTINEFLNAQVQTQTSTNSAASTVQSYYSQIENLLGQPGASDSIDQGINSFFSNVQSYANSPSVSGQTTVVDSAVSMANQISGLASGLYNLQLQADNQITSSINSVNADLKTLQTINNNLEQATATDQSTAGILDQRDATLNDIAQYMNITPTFSSDGAVTVNTSNGVTLLTPTTLSQLSYTPANGVNTFINNDSLSPIQVTAVDANGNPTGNPTNLATGGTAANVSTSITSGQIQGLLSIRDSVIPSIMSQLDQLASTVRDQVNAITNAGTSSPPPNSYTGNRLISGSSTSLYSGSVQIAVLNSDGSPIASPYADEPNGMPPLTLNLATLNTGSGAGMDSVDGIINAINQYYGPPQNKVELGNINNAQLAIASPQIPDVGDTLSFGLNLSNITGSSANATVTGISVVDNNGNAATLSGTGLSATVGAGQTVNTTSAAGGTITATFNPSNPTPTSYTVTATISTVNSAGNTVTSTVTYNVPNGTFGTMNNLIGASVASGNGTLVAPTTTQAIATATLVNAEGVPLTKNAEGLYGSQSGYLKITADNSTETIAINQLDSKQLGLPSATPPQAGTNQGFSQYFGLNDLFNPNSLTPSGDTLANSALNFSVESRIINNNGLVSAATLSKSIQPTDTTSPPNYTYQVSSGDTSISQELAGLSTSLISFNSAGGLAGNTTTLSQYAGQIIATASTNSSTATNNATDSQTLLSGFTTRAQAVSGVNLDQELANTVIYQNAYSASTRVITVVSNMFSDLLGIIQ